MYNYAYFFCFIYCVHYTQYFNYVYGLFTQRYVLQITITKKNL